MKLIIGTMLAFYILNFWLIPHHLIYPWGGVYESYLYPIYTGMVLLAGLIVTCTKVVLERIKEINSENKNDSH